MSFFTNLNEFSLQTGTVSFKESNTVCFIFKKHEFLSFDVNMKPLVCYNSVVYKFCGELNWYFLVNTRYKTLNNESKHETYQLVNHDKKCCVNHILFMLWWFKSSKYELMDVYDKFVQNIFFYHLFEHPSKFF